VTVPQPSLLLLRSLSDELVVRVLAAEPRLTRAEIATLIGLSKPTVAESVRRLESAGIVADTGERTTSRGGVGSYYALADGVGTALAIHVAAESVTAEVIDPYGSVLSRASAIVPRPATQAVVKRTLKAVASQALADRTGPVRVAVVSAADPVNRRTGSLVQLPDAPFLVGNLSPADALEGVVHGEVLVDNDVNWAARAERTAHPEGTFDDFAYLFLGEGLGCAIVSEGVVVRGHTGIAGEVAHVLTTAPDGSASFFTEVFSALHLRQSDSTAIDVGALIEAAADRPEVRLALARAVSGVLGALVALSDPSCVVVGGPWGSNSVILEAVRTEFASHPRAVPLVAPAVIHEQTITGARDAARAELQSALVRLAIGDVTSMSTR
jgi:predicted NBD/HSP70 family sugar kinase